MSLSAFHLARNPCESVPGVLSCRPPATESLRKCSRCLFPPSTWHGNPAKACQVSFPAAHLPRFSRESVPGVSSRRPPATESLRKCSRCLFPPSTCHGNPCKSVPGVLSRRPPGTESPQKCTRCPFPPPTWHGIPAKACQVAPLASHLARYPRKSVPGVLFRLPPGTVSTQKCTRCPFPPPTWHGIPAKAFQVSLPAFHLPRNPCESVPGVPSRCPPGTESLQKRVRCLFPLPTCYGIPTKACQVVFPVSHLARNPCKSVPGVSSRLHLARKSRKSVPGGMSRLPPGTVSLQKRVRCPIPPSTCHGNPAKACQVSHPAFHLARKSRESVSGSTSCLPPGTEFPQKCVRCHLLPSTWHGIPAKAFHVAPLAFHLLRQFLSSWDVGTFQQGKLVVFSKKRATIGTPEVGECVHLSENHDVSKKVQLRVCRVMLHLEMTTSCDPLIIRDFAIYAICGCASA